MDRRFEAVIGLEIHAQLDTRTKAFCGCPTRAPAGANSAVCPVCLGWPGALPVLNGAAVNLAIRAALALGCTVHHESVFARKHYFYPDLPKGFQITQYDRPLATSGLIDAEMAGPDHPVRIARVHLEEDAGKSLHAQGGGRTGLDFNRSGIPLVEIVTAPDIRSPGEAASVFRRVRETLVALGVNDGSLEAGSLRCDANVSVRLAGAEDLATRTEIKNLNSFRFLQKALEYEVERQIGLVGGGKPVVADTRLFDEASGTTSPMRDKESSADYRYLSEPDLPALVIAPDRLARLAGTIPELPAARRRRLVASFGLDEASAVLFTQGIAGLDAYFVALAEQSGDLRAAANWVRGDVVHCLAAPDGQSLDAFTARVPPSHLARLIGMVGEGRLNGPSAKEVFAEMVRTGEPPGAIAASRGLAQMSDEALVRALVLEALAAHPGPLAQYRAGRTKVFGFFVGQVMKASGGRANTELVNRLLAEQLDRR